MAHPFTRREFCRAAALSAGGALASRHSLLGAALLEQPGGWAAVPGILSRIVPPTFPALDFDITTFGAKGDGVTDSTAAVRGAVAACARAGGGRVVVPSGQFVTGAVQLQSRVELHLTDGAVLRFSQAPRDYLPVVLTRFEGVELYNYSPFIYALDASDIAISGRGVLDGRADAEHWWPWKSETADRNRLFQLAEQGVPVAERRFGDGHFLRPNFIQPYRCTNVLIEGVTILNSPMWEIHPVLSKNVTIRGVTIVSHGPNNDGCDPESCRDVLIEACTFDTGDDCIAIKSGRNGDGRRLHAPVENVIVRNCTMKDGHGGVTIGSEISGGARFIFAEQCRMDSPRLDRVLRFKNNAMRGGTIEHVYMRDVTVGEVAESVVNADFYYEEGEKGSFTPVLRDVEVRSVTSKKSKYALYLRGFAQAPIVDVRIVDCTFDGVAEPDVLESVRDVTLENVRVNGRLRNERISR